MPSPIAPAPVSDTRTWVEVARVFGRLGLTAFGGPAAHIAAMEDEIVKRRQWISRDDFVDLVGASNLIPGPNSTELAIHLGYRRAGWAALLAVFSLVAVLAGLSELTVLLAALLVSVLIARLTTANDDEHRQLAAVGAVAAVAAVGAVGAVGATMSAPSVFLSFAKIGSVLFGSGYVLLTFLRGEFVLRHAVLTDAQLLDAIAVGQVTPGPVFSAATFVGYLIAGHAGAAAATAGLFLPAFVGVALSAPYVARLRGSRRWSSAFDGMNAASLALMASVVPVMARPISLDPATLAILTVAAAVLVFTRIGRGWVLLAAGAVGLLRAVL